LDNCVLTPKTALPKSLKYFYPYFYKPGFPMSYEVLIFLSGDQKDKPTIRVKGLEIVYCGKNCLSQ